MPSPSKIVTAACSVFPAGAGKGLLCLARGFVAAGLGSRLQTTGICVMGGGYSVKPHCWAFDRIIQHQVSVSPAWRLMM